MQQFSIKSSYLFSDMIAIIICEFIVRYQYYTIDFRYKNVTQNALFFAYKNVMKIVRIFVYKNVMQGTLFFSYKIQRKVHCFLDIKMPPPFRLFQKFNKNSVTQNVRLFV